jgi:hypothetical protein
MIGAVLGTLTYKVFIEWQLPDPDLPSDLPIPPIPTKDCKELQAAMGNGVELKTARF